MLPRKNLKSSNITREAGHTAQRQKSLSQNFRITGMDNGGSPCYPEWPGKFSSAILRKVTELPFLRSRVTVCAILGAQPPSPSAGRVSRHSAAMTAGLSLPGPVVCGHLCWSSGRPNLPRWSFHGNLMGTSGIPASFHLATPAL